MNSLSLSGRGPSVAAGELEVARGEHRKFCALKALRLTFGCCGLGVVFAPVKAVQLLATRKVMYTSAEVDYVCGVLKSYSPSSFAQDETAQPKAEYVREVASAILSQYAQKRFFKSESDSSQQLISDIRNWCAPPGNTPLDQANQFIESMTGKNPAAGSRLNPSYMSLSILTGKIVDYLKAVEEPFDSRARSKNQGKRLFNIVMQVVLNQPCPQVPEH
jgi:hypothetical protein